MFVSQQIKKENGVRTIAIDPRYSETSVALGDEWIALRPGTDAALIAGMIYVMVEEDLHDQEFLDKYCIGVSTKSTCQKVLRRTLRTAPILRG